MGYPIIVETSARHVHVTIEALETLYGKGYELHVKRYLSQPGEFLSEEKVKIEGPKGAIDNVSVLGPTRKAVQAEVSLTDARALGVAPPIRLSGHVVGSAPVRLVGPAGSVDSKEGCVAAKRHIHLVPESAARLGIADGQVVKVAVSGERAVVFDEVVVRVSANFADRMHIDFDEANAAGLSGETVGEIFL